MKREKKDEEWAGNLQEELEELKNMEMKAEGIETYGSISVGCTQILTVVCC